MNKKTINKTITAKITEWTDTITDKDLRRDTLESAIVTGGCIASMYMNVPVNDFDVYISNKDVLHRLMKYYIKGQSGIRILDGDNYSTKKEKSILDIDDVENGLGIAIGTLEKGQLKFYMEHGAGGMEFLKKDSEDQHKKEYKKSFISPNAISLTDKLQIVNRFYGDPKEIHKNYDFVHATNYWTKEDGLVINTDALNSILTMTLSYQGSRYPVTSIIRMKKFIKRGFNINAGEIFKMIFQASLLDLQDPHVLEEQLIGVDIAYFAELIEELQKIKEDKDADIDSTTIFAVINRLFNE